MENTKGVYENYLLNFGRKVGFKDMSSLIKFKKIDVELKTVCVELALEKKNFNQTFLDNCYERVVNVNEQFNNILSKF